MPARTVPHRASRRPQLERRTPIVALAVARQVVEEVAHYLGVPVPPRHAARLASRARAIYASSPAFRARIDAPGDAGRDCLHTFMRHWLAAILKADQPGLYDQLPASFSIGKPLPASQHLSPEARLMFF